MASVNSSVATVNAAAAAIVTAETRVQPDSVQKKRWGSCLNLHWCFGFLKSSKRISHATLVPEPPVTENATVVTNNPNSSSSIVFPFIAPPSSPSSFQQSDPPTAIHSPGGSLTRGSISFNAYCSAGQAHIFTIGPYAHETQLVSPPVFSTVNTEPSTAAVTPPPEPVHLTTPSSPDVPFAELLTSSLNRARRNSGGNQKLALSCYEVHHLISPGSANSASGTSSPYPDKRPVLEFRMVDASKVFDSKKFYTRKWGSKVGSRTLIPDGVGFSSYDISEVASQANSETESLIEEALNDPRVSFEINCEDKQNFSENVASKTAEIEQETMDQSERQKGTSTIPVEVKEGCKLCIKEHSTETHEPGGREFMDCKHKQSSLSLGSVKEFNFDSIETEIPVSSVLSSEWWADEKPRKDVDPENKNWSFFPLLQPGVS